MIILFDLDDTLVNHSDADLLATKRLHETCAPKENFEHFHTFWKQAQEKHYKRYYLGEISFQEQRRARIRETLGHSLTDADADFLFDHYLRTYEESWRLFDDVLPCFERLSCTRLGLVTNGDGLQQRKKIERLGIKERFDCIVVSSECGLSKPDPGIFLHTCNLMNEKPSSAAYIGDRYDLDALASRKAGLVGIWLDRGAQKTSTHTHPIISTLSEINDPAQSRH